MPKLLTALESRESGIVIHATERPDICSSPPPRYDLLDLDLYVDMAVQFSRGCPFHCEFCDNHADVRARGEDQITRSSTAGTPNTI